MKKAALNPEEISKRDEQRVRDYLEFLGLKVKKIDSKANDIKSPDFLVEAQDGFCFYCEIKSSISDISEAILHKTKFAKLERKIAEAFDQFSSVNGGHFAPNVLFFLSNDFRVNYTSLLELFRGYVDVLTEKVDTTKYRDSKAYGAIRNIDLFAWFVDREHVDFFISNSDQRFLTHLQRIFRKDKIDHVIRI